MVSLMHKFFVMISLSVIFSTTLVVYLDNYAVNRSSNISGFKNQTVHNGKEKKLFYRTVKYMDENSKICNASENHLKLLIIVTSAPSHEPLRAAIRNTWGRLSDQSHIIIAFLIGFTYDKTIEESLLLEQYFHGDLIRASFVDTYDNMTLKTITMLDWANRFCKNTKFLLKADDDTFINVYRLNLFLSIIPEENDAVYGYLLEDSETCRNVSSKYYLSVEQYEHRYLPDFLSGATYLIPMHLTEKLLLRSQMLPLFKLEDVFITGFVANDLEIQLVHTSMFHFFHITKKDYCYVRFLISVHYVNVLQQYDLWRIIRYPKQSCWRRSSVGGRNKGF